MVRGFRSKITTHACIFGVFSSIFQLVLVSPSYATIDNTITVQGTVPGGVVNGVVASASESVDVEDAVPQLSMVKTSVLNDERNVNGLAELGETTTYLYEVSNTGNVTLQNITIQDTHEGTLLSPSPAGEVIIVEGPNQPSDIGIANDGLINTLEVGAVATFTVTLPITQEEIDNQ